MTNLLEEFNNQQISLSNKKIPEFRSGYTIKVSMRIIDGVSERIQVFEGVCIKIRNRGLHSSFTLRKVSFGESIQLQVFHYSPSVESIEVIKQGKVRRAKLYYMLERFGKKARIKELDNKNKKSSKSKLG